MLICVFPRQGMILLYNINIIAICQQYFKIIFLKSAFTSCDKILVMVKMNFEDETLERLFRSFKEARNNSIQLFKSMQDSDTSQYSPTGDATHTALYQFQCIVTITDGYYRRLQGAKNRAFDVAVDEDSGAVIARTDIVIERIEDFMIRQGRKLEELLHLYDADDFKSKIHDIQAIVNYEYLHQGQLAVLFREMDVPLPEKVQGVIAL